MADYNGKVRAALAPSLPPGETLHGACFGSRWGMMSSKMVAVGVTDQRLVIQETDRKLDPKGAPVVLSAKQIDRASAGGAGRPGGGLQGAIMNRVALAVTVRTRAGEKIKLKLTRGGGPGGLLGGPEQERGVDAIISWLEAATAA